MNTNRLTLYHSDTSTIIYVYFQRKNNKTIQTHSVRRNGMKMSHHLTYSGCMFYLNQKECFLSEEK